jgi:transcriptional regulator of arginine metabolism
MQKEQRQKRILELIGEIRIETQEHLAELLLSENIPVTQSSISRDLLDLGVIKVDGAYAVPTRPDDPLSMGLLELRPAGESLIVAKTKTGMASAVCVVIDGHHLEEVVGTIAGEDTIFIAVGDKKAQKSAMTKIWEMFNR